MIEMQQWQGGNPFVCECNSGAFFFYLSLFFILQLEKQNKSLRMYALYRDQILLIPEHLVLCLQIQLSMCGPNYPYFDWLSKSPFFPLGDKRDVFNLH